MSAPDESVRLVSARRQPPRLVLLFAVLTALAVAAAAGLILVVVREADVAQAHAHAIERARFAARSVLAPELRASDLASTPSAQRRRALDALFRTRVLVEGIRAATLYSSDGRRVFADPDEGAPTASEARHVRDALSGATVSEMAASESGVRVLRTYVPIGGSRSGVVRLDQGYEPVIAAARRSSWLIAVVLEGLLVILFIALLPLLVKAASRIRAHVADLEHVASHDELTGLPNRRGFRHAAETALASGRSSAVLLVDLDGFSEINSSLGSASGDRLLTEAGTRIQQTLDPAQGLVARLGDDEFGVLLHDADESASRLASERIRKRFAEPFVVDGVRVAVSVDIGAGLFPDHGPTLHSVLRCAAVALAAAKAEDHNGVEVYRPAFAARDRSRLEIVAELRDALAADQFLVYYQPQADLLTQQIRGAEALLRWQHPQRGLLTAGEFISYAERGGLAQELRRFVVDATAQQWLEWRMLGFDLEVAINLGGADMLDPALPGELGELITAYGIPPSDIVLEVTEHMLIADVRRARTIVERLHRLGVRISIDDFGTGYSSLASLRHFPIEQVKLDQSLIADVPGGDAAEAIVGGSVEIAHGLGALVVAEGIETREQWRFAYTMGCDIAQGHLIGEPAPAEELLAFLDAPRLIPLSVA
jgi:diguanylate cyclase (GGDEF)-like protein